MERSSLAALRVKSSRVPLHSFEQFEEILQPSMANICLPIRPSWEQIKSTLRTRGVISSFIALAADSHPHFTTIAGFIASMKDEITPLFRNVLLICSQKA